MGHGVGYPGGGPWRQLPGSGPLASASREYAMGHSVSPPGGLTMGHGGSYPGARHGPLVIICQ